jgi:serine/threonine-protein kinase
MNYGDFQLRGLIAEGGCGRVYFALPKRPGTTPSHFAIKIVRPEHADNAEFMKLFDDEARLAPELVHSNVVRTYGSGVSPQKLPFLVMEYLEGISLAAVCQKLLSHRQVLHRGVVSWIGARVAEALAYVHHAQDQQSCPLGVVHRDVNPTNIFLTTAGEVKLIDFGLAKAAQHLAHTRTGQFKGKLEYMAPEQTTVEGLRATDHRVDIFALGVTLWELVAGTRLFKRDTDLATFEAVKRCKIPTLRTKAGGCPPGLEAAISKALAVDRDQRYADAGELWRVLDGIDTKVKQDHVKQVVEQCFPTLQQEQREWSQTAFDVAKASPKEVMRPSLEHPSHWAFSHFWTPSKLLFLDLAPVPHDGPSS